MRGDRLSLVHRGGDGGRSKAKGSELVRVLDPAPRSPELDELVKASARARDAALAAVARSRELSFRAHCLQQQVAAGRLRRRARVFARVSGLVDGAVVAAVVGTDGSVTGDAALLARAGLIVAVGDTFDDGRLPARLGGEPLATTLTLTRACDAVRQVELSVRAHSG